LRSGKVNGGEVKGRDIGIIGFDGSDSNSRMERRARSIGSRQVTSEVGVVTDSFVAEYNGSRVGFEWSY
jgi:hypothetical protein